MDDNEKRLEILRRTKKRRKQLDITVILAALAVYDLRRTKRQLEEQDRREQEKK